MDLFDKTALSFDCYGTLIDWESGIFNALQSWSQRTVSQLDNEALLKAFGAVETIVERETPELLYPEVLAESLRRIASTIGVDVTMAETEAFGNSVGYWPAFSDSADALRRLQTRFKLIILSNINRASFALSQPILGVDFDLVITAEDVGSYKPDQRNFDRLFADIGSIGIDRSQLVHVAESLYHDHGPAQRNNLPSVWIHRRFGKEGTGATHQPEGVIEPEWHFTSMSGFADAALGNR